MRLGGAGFGSIWMDPKWEKRRMEKNGGKEEGKLTTLTLKRTRRRERTGEPAKLNECSRTAAAFLFLSSLGRNDDDNEENEETEPCLQQ